jgi:hypothetical protein
MGIIESIIQKIKKKNRIWPTGNSRWFEKHLLLRSNHPPKIRMINEVYTPVTIGCTAPKRKGIVPSRRSTEY